MNVAPGIKHKLLLILGLLMLGKAVAAPMPGNPAVNEVRPALDASKVRLGSVKAAVYAPETGELLYQKNADTPTPIASITKMMTAMVILDAKQPLDEWLTAYRINHRAGKNAYSRIRPGSRLRRSDLLLLALMSSENLAASTLADNYPGGFEAFVAAMNAKAQQLGMDHSHFVDGTGLSANNVSTAADLVKMVAAAVKYPLIHQYSTTHNYTMQFRQPDYSLYYGNTNGLVRSDDWDIALSKTGFINEAGHCLVMMSEIKDQPVIMVFLDSFGKYTHVGDATRIKRWISTGVGGTVAGAALNYERMKVAQIRR